MIQERVAIRIGCSWILAYLLLAKLPRSQVHACQCLPCLFRKLDNVPSRYRTRYRYQVRFTSTSCIVRGWCYRGYVVRVNSLSRHKSDEAGSNRADCLARTYLKATRQITHHPTSVFMKISSFISCLAYVAQFCKKRCSISESSLYRSGRVPIS